MPTQAPATYLGAIPTGYQSPSRCKNPNLPWKEAVFSRYFKGDSVKTDRYRYTEWRDKDGSVYARMLYDHKVDSVENVNIAELPQNKKIVKKLSNMLREIKN